MDGAVANPCAGFESPTEVTSLKGVAMSPLNVRFGGPKADSCTAAKTDRYLITLSAHASNWGAISRPRADIRARRTSDFGLKQTCTTRDFAYARPALRMPSRNLAIGPAV